MRGLRLSEEEYERLKIRHQGMDKPNSRIPLQPPSQENASESKYRSQRVECDGEKFDSKKELSRYRQLKMLQQAGQITGLVRQKPFELIPSVMLDGKKQRPVQYIADFCYIEDGKDIVEDCKGFRTPEYKLKRKMMKHILGIEIRES